jgi:hypothetical protein
MRAIASDISQRILTAANNAELGKGDGKYRHRGSAVSRCTREMVLHAMGVPWTNPPNPLHGDQIVFHQGHDIEDRIISYMEAAGIPVGCSQMEVTAITPVHGVPVKGHIDGIAFMPEGTPLAGQWFLFDVKSAGTFGYKMVQGDRNGDPKPEHRKQLEVYAFSTVTDQSQQYDAVRNTRLCDLHFEGFEFGGCMVVYCAKERPTKYMRGGGKEELPRIHTCVFEVEEVDHDVTLEHFDLVEEHIREGTIPPIPDKADEMVWGRIDKKTGAKTAVRCDPRWCKRYDACQGKVSLEDIIVRED